MKQRALIIVILAAVAGGGWWLWNHQPAFLGTLHQYIENGDLQTLEARYSAEHLMEAHRRELLASPQYTFQEPQLVFSPYLLMEAKYTHPDKKTREGVLLWSLVDGEIVLDTDTWETTHGFEDAIHGNASRNDFKIMYALEKNGGAMSREALQHELHLEGDIVEPWIASAIQKHLVVFAGGELRLHLQNPHIAVLPQTKVRKALVSRPYSYAQCLDKKFSRSQLESASQSAFGQGFTIRKTREVYLPVHCIRVMNPDGSILTTYWNALNGRQIQEHKIFE